MKCAYFRERPVDPSSPDSGYVQECGKTGGEVVLDLYCRGSFYYCPYMGGDDRFRREDALTEDVTACVSNSVARAMEDGNRLMHGLLRDMGEVVARTNYQVLLDIYCQAGSRYISIPSVSGSYLSMVKTQMETKQAGILESAIQKSLNSFQPSALASWITIDGSRLDISDRDFEQLGWITGRWGEVAAAFDQKVDCCNIPKYGAPAERALRAVADEAGYYLRYFEESFYRARQWLASNVERAADLSRWGYHGYDGILPEWGRR